MNATEVVGYTEDGEFYCAECASNTESPVFAGSEWDYYPTCGNCGEQCNDISLTTDGERWLKAQQEM